MTAAERLSACLDELASAVHRAGTREADAARLLELAALAIMRAVELEHHLASRNAPRRGAADAAAGATERACFCAGYS